MKWRLEYTARARKQLQKLNPNQRKILLSWIDKHLDGCENPRATGKALTGEYAGQWRYRVGDYRILCEIHDDEVTILALNVIHRSRAYR